MSRSSPEPKKTIAIILSSMRSGSTLLKALLAQAQDISHLPEVQYRNFVNQKNIFHYQASRLSDKPIVLLKKPFVFSEVGRKWRSPNQEVKQIIMVRDVYSTVKSLEKMLQLHPRERAYTKKDLVDYWCSTYESIMMCYRMNIKNTILVRYEDLLKRPKEETVKLFKFLGSSQNEGVDSYSKPANFEWKWDIDDGGDKIQSLKVQAERASNQFEDDELIEVIYTTPRVYELRKKFSYLNHKPKYINNHENKKKGSVQQQLNILRTFKRKMYLMFESLKRPFAAWNRKTLNLGMSYSRSTAHAPKGRLSDVTAIIKTFERPRELDRLIKSLKKYYPSLSIIVADDSVYPEIRQDVPYYVLPYDAGLSAGRNYLIHKVNTKYVILFDDDHVCTENTKIHEMRDLLENYSLDIVAGDFINEGKERNCFHGIYEFKNDLLYQHIGKNKGIFHGYPLYDVVHNFFIARTDVLKKIKWDERIKYSKEHADFFLRARGKVRITRLAKFSVDHYDGKKYHGKKSKPYREIFNRKWNVADRVNVRERSDLELNENYDINAENYKRDLFNHVCFHDQSIKMFDNV